MSTVRPAAVAGTFYPGDPETLRSQVDALLAGVDDVAADRAPEALIVPHAGYRYSGPVAAHAYARLRPFADQVRSVVLVGPPHRVPVRGMAVSGADALATPLGAVDVDDGLRAELLRRADVYVDDRAHADEHSLEVHLPFLQRLLAPGWTVLPVLASGMEAPALADVFDSLWGRPGVLLLISTDLSHYDPHEVATAHDQHTAAAIVARHWHELDGHDACGACGVRGALESAIRRGAAVELLDRRTSADTAGGPERVVGYGSFAIYG